MDRDQDILDYVQDRMSPEGREAFETAMARDAALTAEVDVMRAVRAELASTSLPDDAEAQWDRISADIDALPQAANDNRAPWVQILKYAAVAVIAVASWQFTVAPRMVDSPGGFRPVSEENVSFSFQVKFVETATLAEIGAVLAPLGGTISEGPSALGLVRLSFSDSDTVEAARRALQDRTDLVEFVAE